MNKGNGDFGTTMYGKVCESENACLTWSVKPAFTLLTMFPHLLKNQTVKATVFRGPCI